MVGAIVSEFFDGLIGVTFSSIFVLLAKQIMTNMVVVRISTRFNFSIPRRTDLRILIQSRR